MRIEVGSWDRGCMAIDLAEVAELWNRSAYGRHSFYPWTGELLENHWTRADFFEPENLFSARVDGRLIGVAHLARVGEYGYAPAWSIEAMFVDPDWRGRGAGRMLLDAAMRRTKSNPADFVDAMGAWPYGPLYTTLADGSERSGIFLREERLLAMFSSAVFVPSRESMIMHLFPQASLSPVDDRRFLIRRRRERTWLDTVFRGRELWDHLLLDRSGQVLSRAIFGRMDGESNNGRSEVYSLFGVLTPEDLRGRGLAKENLTRLVGFLGSRGVRRIELHVYVDNEPAVRLYTSVGFKEVARTVMMRHWT